MNTKTRQGRGFTLIELLTVIAIIGILAGIIIPAVGAVQNNARKAKQQAIYSQWASALALHKQDYGYFPRDLSLKNAEDRNILILALTGVSPGGGDLDTINPKRISYYSFSEGELTSDLDNPWDSPATDLEDSPYIIDTFGNHDIRVVFDNDRDGVIRASDIEDIENPKDVRAPVIVYSVEDEDEDFPEIRSW